MDPDLTAWIASPTASMSPNPDPTVWIAYRLLCAMHVDSLFSQLLVGSMRSVGRAQNTTSVACSLPHAVVHHDVVLLGHVHDISEPTAVESAYCKRADASLWYFDLGHEW